MRKSSDFIWHPSGWQRRGCLWKTMAACGPALDGWTLCVWFSGLGACSIFTAFYPLFKEPPQMNFTQPVSQSKDPCQEIEQSWLDDFKTVKSLVKILLGTELPNIWFLCVVFFFPIENIFTMLIRLANTYSTNYVSGSKCFAYSMYVILAWSYGEGTTDISILIYLHETGTESLTDLPKVTKWVNVRAGIRTQLWMAPGFTLEAAVVCYVRFFVLLRRLTFSEMSCIFMTSANVCMWRLKRASDILHGFTCAQVEHNFLV